MRQVSGRCPSPPPPPPLCVSSTHQAAHALLGASDRRDLSTSHHAARVFAAVPTVPSLCHRDVGDEPTYDSSTQPASESASESAEYTHTHVHWRRRLFTCESVCWFLSLPVSLIAMNTSSLNCHNGIGLKKQLTGSERATRHGDTQSAALLQKYSNIAKRKLGIGRIAISAVGQWEC